MCSVIGALIQNPTLKDFEKFFYAFGIQVKVYDIYKQEIYKFDGIKNNKKFCKLI